MEHTYHLPDENGNPETKTTDKSAVIIIGANGSGKSHLGAWMERNDPDKTHRLSGQRSLNFKDAFARKGLSEAKQDFLCGKLNLEKSRSNEKLLAKKWGKWGDGSKDTTTMTNDFDDVLAYLAAKHVGDLSKSREKNHDAEKDKNSSPDPDEQPPAFKMLTDTWNSIFPHRKLSYDAAEGKLSTHIEESDDGYPSTQMSDGERAVLYLIAETLCVPDGYTLIIDEPELHIHRSIMNEVWNRLESVRPDCLFVYITHDTYFAANHDGEKIWVWDYDGNRHWEYEDLPDGELTEEINLSILGSRQNVLFIEGEDRHKSIDINLYEKIYRGYRIVPSGGCKQVLNRVTAFNSTKMLHRCSVYGLTDRDFRTSREISSHKKKKVYTLGVAEIENLFLAEGVIRAAARHLNKGKKKEETDKIVETVKSSIRNEFSKDIDNQINESVATILRNKVQCVNIPKTGKTDINSYVKNGLPAMLDVEKTYTDTEKTYRNIAKSGDYDEIIKVFNLKGNLDVVANKLGFKGKKKGKQYVDLVLTLMDGEERKAILKAMKKYLPKEIPVVF